MAKKKDFRAFDVASGINSFLSEETKNPPAPSVELSTDSLSSTYNDPLSTTHESQHIGGALQPKRGRPRQYTNTLGESVNRSEKITIYLTSEQNQMVDYIARIKGVSKSTLLTNIVEKEMKTPEYRRAYEAMKEIQAQL